MTLATQDITEKIHYIKIFCDTVEIITFEA